MKDEHGIDMWQCSCNKWRYRFQITCPCGLKNEGTPTTLGQLDVSLLEDLIYRMLTREEE